jgi:hypothetical protein
MNENEIKQIVDNWRIVYREHWLTIVRMEQVRDRALAQRRHSINLRANAIIRKRFGNGPIEYTMLGGAK